jgi:hypothetical protein
MDDVASVRRLEGFGEFGGDIDDARDRQQIAARRDVERFPFDVLHHDEQPPVGVADFVDLADERMVQRGRGKRLAPEPLARDGIPFRRRREDLDGHASFEAAVLGEEDLAHATGADRRHDAIPVIQGIQMECADFSSWGGRADPDP